MYAPQSCHYTSIETKQDTAIIEQQHTQYT